MTYNPQWRKGFSFGTVAVSGQPNVVADADPDTLTLVEGSNVTITTDATTDAVTIAAAGGSLADGDYGAITVSGSGTVWTLDTTLDAVPTPVASVNFADQQAVSLRIENRTSDPGSPSVGQLWLRTDL